MKKYTAKYFKENLPEWKRKKDSFLVRSFFRPLSFYTASFAANRGIGANSVSYFSMLIAVVGSICYLMDNRLCYIAGAALIIFWMVLDCTDGNIARSVKKELYGEFADGASSYVLINFLFFALGIAAYKNQGLIFDASNWALLILGGFAGASDSLTRLLYQKFENTKMHEKPSNRESVRKGGKNKLVVIHDRIDKEVGLNGIFLPALLLCSVMRWFDIFVLFYFLFFTCTLLATMALLIYKSRTSH